MAERRDAYGVLVQRLGRFRSRWEDNVKMGLREVGCEDMDYIDLAHDRKR
jgi:hypothetical protein